MAGFNIISVTGQSPKKAASLFPRGLKLESALTSIIGEHTARVAELGLQAAKSAVPVRTKELRESIRIGDHGPLHKEVYIETAIHESSRTRFKLNNPTLGETVNEGFSRNISHPQVLRPDRARSSEIKFKRNFDSIAEGPFSSVAQGQPTTGWIELARRNIHRELGT